MHICIILFALFFFESDMKDTDDTEDEEDSGDDGGNQVYGKCIVCAVVYIV
jgi:hypothetical protein